MAAMRLVPLLLLALAGLPVVAAEDGGRAALRAERQAAEARFAAEETDCGRHFAVNACLDDVRARKRESLRALQARAQVIADRERRQRADDRMGEIERRRAAAASAPAAEARPARAAAEPPAAPSATPRRSPQGAGSADTAAERVAKAQDRLAAAERRRQAAEADRARIAARMERRSRAGKVAAPLPDPASTPAR